jgi:hypothetical protein
MALPIMTPEQRDAALAKAAAMRKERAEVKASIRQGGMMLPEVIRQADTSDVIGKMKVSAVLQALPGMGPVKTKDLMNSLGIAENRRVRGLTARQRAALETVFAPLGA